MLIGDLHLICLLLLSVFIYSLAHCAAFNVENRSFGVEYYLQVGPGEEAWGAWSDDGRTTR